MLSAVIPSAHGYPASGSGSPVGVATDEVASQGSVPFGVLICARPAGSIGSLLPSCSVPFPARANGFSPDAVPRIVANTSSSSRKLLLPLQRHPLVTRSAVHAEQPPLGLRSLFAASTSLVVTSGLPTERRAPSRFSRPRGLPKPIFAGLFHPATTSRVLPTGVCSSTTA